VPLTLSDMFFTDIDIERIYELRIFD